MQIEIPMSNPTWLNVLKLEHERRHFETNKVSWPHTENHHEKTIFLIIYFRVALD